jgi:hypothetical protein
MPNLLRGLSAGGRGCREANRPRSIKLQKMYGNSFEKRSPSAKVKDSELIQIVPRADATLAGVA